MNRFSIVCEALLYVKPYQITFVLYHSSLLTLAPLRHLMFPKALQLDVTCDQHWHCAVSGQIAVVGPPLSCLDADLAFQSTGAASKDARQAAQMNAAAQEARNLLGRHRHI